MGYEPYPISCIFTSFPSLFKIESVITVPKIQNVWHVAKCRVLILVYARIHKDDAVWTTNMADSQ